MIQPIPPGTRDVLPDEMRELRALSSSLHASFEKAGYGEVWTPAMEYEDVMRRGDERTAGSGFRLFDDAGRLLVLRSDMTIPIARVVATRFQDAEMPLRLCYFAHSYRAVKSGTGQSREFLQAGVELIGVPGPEGEAEAVSLALEGLSEAGLARHRIGLGDGDLYRSLLANLEVPDEEREDLLGALSRRDLVELEARTERLSISPESRALLTRLPTLRGGIEVLGRANGPVSQAVERLRELYELLAERGVADRVIFDLGLVRELGYYTGPVWEVYDPAVGFMLGGGGRYDDMIGRFGRDLPACGTALDVERVHIAKMAEEKG
ncbi:MAG: ATP phosphoribosyltransferase regulatory subunit [Thermoleophilaceae bacterium]|nr:ATP phosphoribosyltransferase regulatory subunit [Thermoleophilaceae bacterium]